MYIVGVDVGGTNTDAVLLQIGNEQCDTSTRVPKVVNTVKAVTSADVFSGMVHAVQQVIGDNEITAIMVGTTHFINALLQRRDLAKVCTIRICGPATHAIPPMSNWPEDLKAAVDGLTVLVDGGYFFDGSEINPLNEDEIRSVVRRALSLDICTFCVTGVFSPCRSDQEKRVEEIIREESSTAYITLSHEIAGLGLVERENAAILNACLRPLAIRTIAALQDALPADVPFFLTKNTGTLLSSEDSTRWPVFTFASGPTNSMIGAAYLSGVKDGIVIDVGGTSIDIGVIIDGRPRQTHANVRLIDDIRVNVTVPETFSLPLGGGTVVRLNEKDASVQIGPDSVAYRLNEEALAFGGQTMTGTDIALAAGLATGIGHRTVDISRDIVEKVLDYIHQSTARGIDRMKTNQDDVPVILCGGGSILIDANRTFPGVSQIIRPNHFSVCNAVGAALCSVSASIDVVVDLLPTTVDGGKQRQRELDNLTRIAYEQCEQNGARFDSIQITDLEQVPLAYQSGGYKHRVQLTTIGQLDFNKLKHNEQKKSKKTSRVSIEKQPPANIKPPIQIDFKKKQPIFDQNGFWCIDAIDIEYIAYGTGILGCGGGGESYHCKLWCLEVLRKDKQSMRVAPASYFSSSSDLVISIGFMGAPTVSHELLSNGRECLQAVNKIEEYLAKKITGIYSAEIGGSNGLMGLLVAASKQVPCVDCDGMGRAFPRLNQFLNFIYNQSVTPACLCDIRGETILIANETIATSAQLEEICRKECTERGLYLGLCLPPLNGEQLQKYAVQHSLSRAWFLGEAKFNNHNNAIEAVARVGQGRVLVSDGKIINVERNTAGGFVRGHVTIETDDKIVIIEFQNENLIARYKDGEIIARVPDLITLIEQDSAEPLHPETIKYGLRVSVLVLPAPDVLVTPQALQYVGLKAFDYDLPDEDYQSFRQLPMPSVWDVFYEKKSFY